MRNEPAYAIVTAEVFAERREPVAIALTKGELSALFLRAIVHAELGASDVAGRFADLAFLSRGEPDYVTVRRLELGALIAECLKWARERSRTV